MTIKIHVEADKYLLTNDNNIVQVCNIIRKEQSEDVVLICKTFFEKSELFITPVKSSKLNIYVVKSLSENYTEYHLNSIKKKKKMIILSINNEFIALPITHSIRE